jgi:HTH-type transcriptional regulator/antitoxin HigA
MMDIRPIKSEQDYEHALARVDELMDAEPGTHEGDELEVLATLVESYEDKHFPIKSPDPVDLEPYLGSRHRVSEVLNRKRELSLNMIRRLHEGLGIPIENLIGKAA